MMATAPRSSTPCAKGTSTVAILSPPLFILSLEEADALEQVQRFLQLVVLDRGRAGLVLLLVVFLVFLLRFFFRLGDFIAIFQVAREIRLPQAVAGFALGDPGLFRHDVRHDAGGLDRAPARRVVTRRGGLERRAVADRDDGLHRTFAETLRAHDDGTFVILGGA